MSPRKDRIIAVSLAGIVLIAAVLIVSALRGHGHTPAADVADLPPADDRVGICTTTDGATTDCASDAVAYKIVSTANTEKDCNGGAFLTYPDKKSYCAKHLAAAEK